MTVTPFYFEPDVWSCVEHKGPARNMEDTKPCWFFGLVDPRRRKTEYREIDSTLELLTFLAGPPEKRLRLIRTFYLLSTGPTERRLLSDHESIGADKYSPWLYKHEFERFGHIKEGLPAELRQHSRFMLPFKWLVLPEKALNEWAKPKRDNPLLSYGLTIASKQEYDEFLR